MRLVNVHTYRPRSLCQWLGLGCSYVPLTVACALIFSIIGPYVWLWCFDIAFSSWPIFMWSVVGGLIFFGLLLTSFYKAAFTSPGYVDPRFWSSPPDVRDVTEEYDGTGDRPVVSSVLCDGSLRYCTRCEVYKPDGAHHCSDCGRCVLKMDHHCPWINNCVGERNEKFFFLFLMYIPISAAHICVTVLVGVHHLHIDFAFRHVWLLLTVVGAATVGVVLGCFALFHAYLIATNRTTIERKFSKSSQLERPWWLVLLTCNLPSPPVLILRFRAVLGPSLWFWYLPNSPHPPQADSIRRPPLDHTTS